MAAGADAGRIKNPTLKVAVHESDEQGNVYTLLEPIEYMGLSIPVGFESDGASVPRFFWRVVFPPGDSRALYAAFVHDCIYRTHPIGWTKEDADKIFEHLLIGGGIPAWRAKLAYFGVKWFGSSAWNASLKMNDER